MPEKPKEISLEGKTPAIPNEAASWIRTEVVERAAAIRARQRPNKTRAIDLIRADRDR